MSEHQIVFKATLARYYKAERDRSEECLGDIIKIVSDSTSPDAEVNEKIIERLVQHYGERS